MKKKMLSRLTNKNALTVLFLIVLYAVVFALVYTDSLSRQMTNLIVPISYYIVLAVSLNLVVGFLGELSLGHAGFMSVGLFSGCLFSIAVADALPLAVRLPVSMILGGLFAALIGLIVGLPALRLKGDYLAIVTLACGEIIRSVIPNLSITGGGIGLGTRVIYEKPKTLLPYAFILVLITVLVMINFEKSKHGRAIMAIRDNRIAAESTGLNVTYYKLLVFVVAAFFAGAAGVLYGHSVTNVQAGAFDYNKSIEILVIVVLGGMGNIPGSIIATIVLRLLPELLREFDEYRMLLYAVLLIVIMILNSNPRFQEWKKRFTWKNLIAKLRSRKTKTPDEAEGKEA